MNTRVPRSFLALTNYWNKLWVAWWIVRSSNLQHCTKQWLICNKQFTIVTYYCSKISYCNQAWARLKKQWSWISNIEKKNSPELRNLVSFWSKFLCSGWKSLRLMNRYDMRHFSNDLFSRCLVWTSFKLKNLILTLFKQKIFLSIV